MNLEDLSRMSETELREKANKKLNPQPIRDVHGDIAMVVPVDLSAAQFFIDEIERRAGEAERKRQKRITTRDLILELVVIVLILGELIYAIYGGNQQLVVLQTLTTSAGQQLELLKKMNANAEQTEKALENLSDQQARTLTAQQQTLQMTTQMNGALQSQLGLSFVPELTLTYDETKNLLFENFGKTNLMVWGSKLEQQITMAPEPRIIVPNTGYRLSVEEQLKEVAQHVPKGGSKQLRFDVYLKNAKGNKFTASYFLIFIWKGDTVSINVQMVGIKPEGW